MDGGSALALIDAVAREATLFAAIGFLIGGIDDCAIDLVFLARLVRSRRRRLPEPAAAVPRLRFAIFVAAWDEAAVIAPMLRATLARFGDQDYRLYVATYPNDRPTIAAAGGVAAGDARVRLVIGARPGPTTKGDNLNVLWRALGRDEAADDWCADAIVLHDAEDVVHPLELAVFARKLVAHQVVQLPVLPLIVPGSRWVSGHYADEFAESHTKSMVVRQALGAGLPLAGVGCAIRRDAVDAIAAARGGDPFDATSLTEDYELGLAIAARGGRGCFARVRGGDGGLVAVRAYFPAGVDAAVRQKARWMTGIALAGWDRLGWGRALDLGEHWMRMRDRRAPLAVLILASAYLALVGSVLSAGTHLVTGAPPAALPGWLLPLLGTNSALLVWRLAMRAICTARIYGWREGVRSAPRMVVANYIALLAARRAIVRYVAMLGGAAPRWDKTSHAFPDDPGRLT